jgi:hypothetical protein
MSTHDNDAPAFWKEPAFWGPAAIVIAALIGLIGLFISTGNSKPPSATPATSTPTLSELAGSISSPQPGERVPNTFTARGTLTSAPSRFRRHVWVAVRTSGGLIPKTEVAEDDGGRWTVLVYEPGCGLAEDLNFSLALISVGNDTHAKIKTRRQQMQFAPVSLQGHIVLDEIQDLGLTRKSDACTS